MKHSGLRQLEGVERMMSTEALSPTASTGVHHVIAKVHNQMVAVPAFRVRELVIQPELTAVPLMPKWLRGVMNWRGKIVPCVDLRSRLGLPDAFAELEKTAFLDAARSGHVAWMEELLRSVEERRPFGLTTDPHGCDFGRWLDNFKTDSLILASLIHRMHSAHLAIHHIAVRVEQLKAKGEYEESFKLIQSHRQTTLQRLLDLLNSYEVAVKESYRPIALIVQLQSALVALLTDSIEAVEPLDPTTVESLEEKGVASSSDLVRQLAQRSRGRGTVGLLESDRVLPELASAGLAGVA